MESASHLDVMRVDELIDAELYARGIELLERIVAMLTKLMRVHGVDRAHGVVPVHERGHDHGGDHDHGRARLRPHGRVITNLRAGRCT